MRGKLLILAAAAALGALALVVTSGAVARGNRTTAPAKVIEHATTDTTTDTGAKGDSVGDVLSFANAVFDSRNRRNIGSDNGYCIRTAVGKAYECNWTTFLPNGQIAVEGPFYDAGDSKLAITGGTGAYANSRGWMLLHARNAKGTEYDFTFHTS
jgi:Allene oxide cyclase barrel like domain